MKEIKDLKLLEKSKLQDSNKKDLEKELNSALKKIFTLRMKKQLGELKQTHLLKFLRRYIARVRTMIAFK